MDDQTKDYIINLRVSRKTYEKIKNKARKNGESISGLIRTLIDDSAEILSDLSGDLRGGKRVRVEDIVSYHPATLARERLCDGCGSLMKKDSEITVGEDAKGRAYYFCSKCR